MATDAYTPRPEHKFSFGLWTVANRGRDPFGEPVRDYLPPDDAAALLGEAGAWGVNLHDNDLVPIDATPGERDAIVRSFKKACQTHGLVVPMATVNLFTDPSFRDGAFTANDPDVRAYALHKTLHAMDLGAELGAKIFVLWGGREGTETDACRRPDEAVKRRAATSTWRPPSPTSDSSRRSITLNSSAPIPRSRTTRSRASTSSTRSR